MVSMFSEIDISYKKKFVELYENFISNPKSDIIKKEADGMGMLGGPQFSDSVNKAASGAYKMELGKLSVKEAKKILEELKKQ